MDKVFIGSRVSKLDTGAPPERVSRVALVVDGSNAYTAGDDTGRTVEKTIPWADQEMAESVLRRLQGVEYRPFSGVDALLDPAAEVGDGVTAGGVYSVLARADITFDGLYSADIAAPGGDEVEDEYPYRSRAQRQSKWELARIRSSITKTAERITLLVENEVEGLSGKLELTAKSLTTEINNTRDGLTSKIEQTAASLTAKINNAEGEIGQLELTATQLQTQISNAVGDLSYLRQTVDSITLGVQNGSESSTITMYKNGIAVSSQNISFTGMVTFDDLDGNHGTIIDGGAIKTNTLFLNSLYGNSIYLCDAMGRVATEFRVTGASTAADALDAWARGIRLNAYPGDIYLNAQQGYVTLDGAAGVTCGNDLYPNRSSSYSCGTYGFPWRDIYSQDGTVSSSDERGKKDIDYGMARYSGLFDRLRPCSFLRTNGTSGRRHHGFLAQEVKAAMDAEGLTGKDFAGYVEWEDGEERGCGLRYEEMLAMLVYEVQQLKSGKEKQ